VNVPQTENTTDEVGAGIAWLFVAHIGACVGFYAINSAAGRDAALYMFYLFGITQLIYAIPMAVIFRKKGRPAVAKGVVIGAAITFLLNAACFGAVFFMLSRG